MGYIHENVQWYTKERSCFIFKEIDTKSTGNWKHKHHCKSDEHPPICSENALIKNISAKKKVFTNKKQFIQKFLKLLMFVKWRKS